MRTIEYGEVQRVGGSETLQVDVRIVGSTNADLRQLSSEGRFREDLLDRLAFDVITVPPLRERVEDIMPLAHAFAINMASELEVELLPRLQPEGFLVALLRNQWPGNVRELKNTIERSVYRSTDQNQPIATLALDPFDTPFMSDESPAAIKDVPASSRRAPLLPADLSQRLVDTEVSLLNAALEKGEIQSTPCRGTLGLSYHQFRGKLKKYNIRSKP